MTIDFRTTLDLEAGSNNWAETAFKRADVKRLESYTEVASGVISVAGVTEETVSLGGVATGQVLYIETDGAIIIKVGNGGDQSLALAPSTGELATLLLDGTTFTTLKFNNVAVTSVLVKWLALG